MKTIQKNQRKSISIVGVAILLMIYQSGAWALKCGKTKCSCPATERACCQSQGFAKSCNCCKKN